MNDASSRNLADGTNFVHVAGSDSDWTIANVLCTATEGPQFACLYLVQDRAAGPSYAHRKLGLLDSNGKRHAFTSRGGDNYSVTGFGIPLHGDAPPLFTDPETVPSGNATRTTPVPRARWQPLHARHHGRVLGRAARSDRRRPL